MFRKKKWDQTVGEPRTFHVTIQKVASVAASVATAAFNTHGFGRRHFDARAFVLPEDEVCNYFVWRQQDWVRNSLQMLARAHFSHSELHEKTGPDIHEMLHGIGVNWADLDPKLKNGRAMARDGWSGAAPTFKDDRAFVERHLAREQG